jgi:hypothetical protein
MAGVFPEPAETASVVTRTASGTATNPGNVSNAYSPAAAFTSTGPLTALPDDDCKRTKLLPKQVNAVNSELICFAEALFGAGNWDQSILCNLRTMFDAWRTGNHKGSLANTLCSAPPGIPLPEDHLIFCDSGGFIRTITVEDFVAAYIPPPTPPSVQCLSDLGGTVPTGPNPKIIIDDTSSCPSFLVYNCTAGTYIRMFGP